MPIPKRKNAWRPVPGDAAPWVLVGQLGDEQPGLNTRVGEAGSPKLEERDDGMWPASGPARSAAHLASDLTKPQG